MRKAIFEPFSSAIAQFNRKIGCYLPRTLFYLITQFMGTADFDKRLIYFSELEIIILH